MTVTTTTARFSYVGDGNAGPDTATGIKVLAATDVKVYWNKATSGSGTPVTVGDTSTAMSASGYLTLNTHYTVQNAGTGNDITITLIASGWTISSTLAYATSSDSLVVTREVPYTQPSNYQNNDTFDAETLEQSLDRSTMQIQQLSDVADRNIVFSSTLADSEFNSASVSGTDFGTARERASTIVASKTSRANKGLKFDANGDIGVSTYNPDEQATLATTQATNASASATLAGNYATKVDGVVTGSDHSSKAWAIGGTGVTDTSSKGASKEWAIETSGTVDTSEYSAKEYAQGTQASTGGSSKSWAQDTDQVNGAGTNDRSAKSWSQGASMTGSTLGGSAKDWAQLAEDSQVNGSEYSAKHYSAKASASATSASNSATSAASSASSAGASAIAMAIALGIILTPFF